MIAVSNASGKAELTTRMMLCMWLQIPIGFFMNRYMSTQGAFARNMFNIVVGILLQTYMYRWDTIHTYLMGYIAYLIMMMAPRAKQHIYVTAYLMIYLSS